jgi:acyl dehydratase
MRVRIATLLGLFFALASMAQAQNLVVNPGFETGDFTGWTVTGATASVESGVGHTGDFAASFGSVSPDVNVLSQTLLTQAGQQYTLTFFLQTPEFNVPPGFPNSSAVSFDGVLIDGPFTVPDDPDYQQYTYTVTALSNAAVLRFEISNDPDYTQLDDISVTLASTTAPEPNALALLTSGSIGGFLMLRSRRKAGFNLKGTNNSDKR